MVGLYKTILLICALMVVITVSQRGGGSRSSSSSSSRSRSSSRRRSGGFLSSFFGNNNSKNCTTIDGKTECTEIKDQQDQIAWYSYIFYAGGIFYLIHDRYDKTQTEKKRKEKIELALKQFQDKYSAVSYEVSSEEKNRMVEEFKKKSYTIDISLTDRSQNLTCPVKVAQLTKIDQSKYSIQMTGHDQAGSSQFRGLLMFTSETIHLKLSKTYNDRKKAGQTGTYDVLFYQGNGTPQRIEGQWAYQGYQSSEKYSGSWNMGEIKAQ